MKEELTPLGKILGNLPVDVSIGKMLVMGCLFSQVSLFKLFICAFRVGHNVFYL